MPESGISTMTERRMSLELHGVKSSTINSRPALITGTQIEQLTFGAIQLDRTGTIVQYNAIEGAITSGSPAQVIGKNFFEEVAPFANTPDFKGAFESVVKDRSSVMIEYIIDYPLTPTTVNVHMKPALVGGNFWIVVKRN
jgi:photoactive yellow protein